MLRREPSSVQMSAYKKFDDVFCIVSYMPITEVTANKKHFIEDTY